MNEVRKVSRCSDRWVNIPDRRNSTCKGPEANACLARSVKGEEAHVPWAEWAAGGHSPGPHIQTTQVALARAADLTIREPANWGAVSAERRGTYLTSCTYTVPGSGSLYTVDWLVILPHHEGDGKEKETNTQFCSTFMTRKHTTQLSRERDTWKVFLQKIRKDWCKDGLQS